MLCVVLKLKQLNVIEWLTVFVFPRWFPRPLLPSLLTSATMAKIYGKTDNRPTWGDLEFQAHWRRVDAGRATADFCNKYKGISALASKSIDKICQPNAIDKPSRC